MPSCLLFPDVDLCASVPRQKKKNKNKKWTCLSVCLCLDSRPFLFALILLNGLQATCWLLLTDESASAWFGILNSGNRSTSDTVYFYLGHNLCHHYSESDLMLFCFSLLLFPMSHLHLHVVHRLFSPVVKFVTCCRSVLSHQFPYQRTLSVDFRLLLFIFIFNFLFYSTRTHHLCVSVYLVRHVWVLIDGATLSFDGITPTCFDGRGGRWPRVNGVSCGDNTSIPTRQ